MLCRNHCAVFNRTQAGKPEGSGLTVLRRASMSDERTASDVLVDRLLDWGGDTIFGLPGDGINGLMEALRRHREDMRYIHVRHEEVAAMAAVGYAKFTGRLGVCFATAGPGAVHLLNGLMDARVEQAPMLAITGMTYSDLVGTSYLQDVNIDYLFNDVALYNQRIMGPQHVQNVVDYAVRTALTQRGPSHLAFPIDYQAAPAESGTRFQRNVPDHTSTAYRPPIRVPTRQDLEVAAAAVRGRRKVAILAGAGARGARAQLEAVAEKLAAPVVKAQLGKDCLPDDSPYTTGSIALVGTRPSEEALERCDALLIVGSTMPYIEFYPEPGQAACVQIDDRPERIGLRHPPRQGQVRAGHEARRGAAQRHPEPQADRPADGQGRARRVQLRRQPRPCDPRPARPRALRRHGQAPRPRRRVGGAARGLSFSPSVSEVRENVGESDDKSPGSRRCEARTRSA
jgi:pyruvate dehydrogenase (quinone)